MCFGVCFCEWFLIISTGVVTDVAQLCTKCKGNPQEDDVIHNLKSAENDENNGGAVQERTWIVVCVAANEKYNLEHKHGNLREEAHEQRKDKESDHSHCVCL